MILVTSGGGVSVFSSIYMTSWDRRHPSSSLHINVKMLQRCCSLLQVINFARVPLRHQLVVMNGGTILDSAFLCW